MRAVIDIGSNSILLLVGARAGDGSVSVLHDFARVARLSEGAAASGRLNPVAIERALAVLVEYRGILNGLEIEGLRAVSTEGVRMAANAVDFLRPAAEVLGVPVQVLSGEEEARLSYRSVALEEPDADDLRVIDIGGASTELVAGIKLEAQNIVSHAIGSVRLTEAYIDADPPTARCLETLEAAVKTAFARQPLDPSPLLFGLAGTVTTAAALMLGLLSYDRERIDGQRFSTEQIFCLRVRLAAMDQGARLALPCLSLGRADVIVAGVTILCAALEHCGATTLVVRDRGLRYSLL